MKKLLPLTLISVFISVLLTACFPFYRDEQEKPRFSAIYKSPFRFTGSLPKDPNKYNYGDSVTILDKGNLEYRDNEFLGWMHNGTLYQPGYIIKPDEYQVELDDNMYTQSIRFTAHWSLKSDFEFDIDGEEAKLIKYNGDTYTDVLIPSAYEGIPVTVIGDEVFRNMGLYRVELPDNLKIIGSFAFSGNLITSLAIPAFAEVIGDGAFEKNSITVIAIPASIKLIGEGAFEGNKIKRIIIGVDVDIASDTSFGTLGESFKKLYEDSGKQAGDYNYTADFWVKI